MLNNWRQIDDEYWMCFSFDVYYNYGIWFASFYTGRRFDKSFSSAQNAMNYCDNLKE